MTHECWDYIYLKGSYPENCKVSKENLDKMRHEFEYWYPLDLRCSGKDLIRNHLTFMLYNHAAVWEDHQMMPKSIFCNGYVLCNGEKMSKSKGNFYTIKDMVALFGTDATRITMADAGDTIDDANFETEFANASVLKLYVFEQWIKDNIKASIPDGEFDFMASKNDLDLWDRIFLNQINHSIETATDMYNQMKFKQALKFGFFELQSIKEDYLIAKEKKTNPYVLMRYVETQLVLLNPVAPHMAQYCWRHYAYPILSRSKNFGKECKENLMEQAWPIPSAAHDKEADDRLAYMRHTKSAIRKGFDNAKKGGAGNKKGGKGGKAKKGQAPEVKEEAKVIDSCAIFIAHEYPEFQKKCI